MQTIIEDTKATSPARRSLSPSAKDRKDGSPAQSPAKVQANQSPLNKAISDSKAAPVTKASSPDHSLALKYDAPTSPSKAHKEVSPVHSPTKKHITSISPSKAQKDNSPIQSPTKKHITPISPPKLPKESSPAHPASQKQASPKQSPAHNDAKMHSPTGVRDGKEASPVRRSRTGSPASRHTVVDYEGSASPQAKKLRLDIPPTGISNSHAYMRKRY